jgi:integrase
MIRVQSDLSSQQLPINIPPLPFSITYYDDFSDTYGEIKDPDRTDLWSIFYDGKQVTLDFRSFDAVIRQFVKCWCANQLAIRAPRTAENYLYGLKQISLDQITAVLTTTPQEARSTWTIISAGQLQYYSLQALKSIFPFMCRFYVGSWSPEWLDYVSLLPLPKVDKYAGVRTGDMFLSYEEEAAIVWHIDDICKTIATRRSELTNDLLETTAILLCSYQFGFRPKQIAMLKIRNIRIWNDGADEYPAVHLTFSMIKQRSPKRVFPMLRRVKREWSPLFLELFERTRVNGLVGADHLFHRTPAEISNVISDQTESLGCRRGATELRHTAAQRLVDAGASEEELAAYMGHSDLNTGLVYFNASRSQAERINQALGVSSTYQNVMKIAHGRFVSPDELAGLKCDQQIAGVPHGMPIAGIGGCELGQPSCPNNPVMSCYGCSRFMPIASVRIHLEVLTDLREVIKFFYASSNAERGSPAFQLEGTIAKVQSVIDELGGQRDELEP